MTARGKVMDPVEQVIWLVENRLVQQMTMTHFAAETGLSRFALTRAFQAATGRTLAEYRRARRLTMAARQLASGRVSVTQAALAAGYAAHEAFSRAFRREFGLAPEALACSRDLSPLTLTEAIRMNADTRSPIEGPEIAPLPATRMVGLSRTYAPGPLAEIPGQWAEFQPYLQSLDPARVPAAFGIVSCATQGRPGEVTYVCAVPIAAGLEPGGDLVALHLPAMKVAKFTYRGHITAIKAATGAAFAALADLGHVPAPGIDLIEYYGTDFDPVTGFGAFGLWIPLA